MLNLNAPITSTTTHNALKIQWRGLGIRARYINSDRTAAFSHRSPYAASQSSWYLYCPIKQILHYGADILTSREAILHVRTYTCMYHTLRACMYLHINAIALIRRKAVLAWRGRVTTALIMWESRGGSRGEGWCANHHDWYIHADWLCLL